MVGIMVLDLYESDLGWMLLMSGVFQIDLVTEEVQRQSTSGGMARV